MGGVNFGRPGAFGGVDTGYPSIPVDLDVNVQLELKDHASKLDQLTAQNNHTITYAYNADGSVNTVTEKDKDNTVIQTVTYNYNASGDVSSSVTVANGKTTTTTYNYDANGNITSTVNVTS